MDPSLAMMRRRVVPCQHPRRQQPLEVAPFVNMYDANTYSVQPRASRIDPKGSLVFAALAYRFRGATPT
jgi:hypothetical protein